MIQTARLHLRPMTENDLVPLSRALNNFRIARNTSRIPWPYRLDDAIAYLAGLRRLGPGSSWLAITRKSEPSVIVGAIGYNENPAGLEAELGYWLDEPCWSRGYGLEAATAMVTHAFTAAGNDRLTASYHHGNEASRRILDRLGFRFTHHEMSHSLARRRLVPTAFTELSRREWLRTPC